MPKKQEQYKEPTLPKIILIFGAFLIFIGLLGFVMLNTTSWLSNGYHTSFKEENFCYNLFKDKCVIEPYESTNNMFGECIYKLHPLQKTYFQLKDLECER